MVGTASIPYWSAAPCPWLAPCTRVQSLDASGGVLGALRPFTVLKKSLRRPRTGLRVFLAPAGFARRVLDSVYQADNFLICEAGKLPPYHYIDIQLSQ